MLVSDEEQERNGVLSAVNVMSNAANRAAGGTLERAENNDIRALPLLMFGFLIPEFRVGLHRICEAGRTWDERPAAARDVGCRGDPPVSGAAFGSSNS